MCTYHTDHVALSGSGKGADGWFTLSAATVYFDHPVHAAAEHTLNVDFINPALGPGAGRRRAGPGLGRALAEAILAAADMAGAWAVPAT